MFISIKPLRKKAKKMNSNIMSYFYVLLFILFSLDFGYVKLKSWRSNLLAKIGSFIVSLFVGLSCLFIVLMQYDESSIMWQTKFVLEYYLYILILFLTPENKSFFYQQKSLHYLDVKLGVNSSKYNNNFKILLFVIFVVLYQIIIGYIFCKIGGACVQSFALNVLLYVPIISYYIPHIVSFFILYSPYQRLKELKKCIETEKFTVRHSHCLYRSLINSTENVLENFKLIFLVSLLFNIPGIMYFIYTLLRGLIGSQVSVPIVILQNFSVAFSLVLKFLPCLTASLLYNTAMKIKVILHDKLLEEHDQIRSQELERFISYIEARPFQFYVLLLIPMDATLPLILLNLCVTYFIVVIQLTHLV